MVLKLTESEIEAARTQKGGFTRETLARWGISWPPPKGWRRALMAGCPIESLPPESEPAERESVPDCFEAKLLHQVVMAVINAGQGDTLKGIDELNAHYGSRLPTVADLLGGRPETAIISGGITWDDKVYSVSVGRIIKR